MDITVSRTGLEKRFFDLFSRLVAENGYQLYDLEYITGSSTLRVFIMNPETKSAQLEDCIKVDHSFDAYIEEDWIPEGFVLEVSSPGIYRKIRTFEQLELSLNEIVEIVLTGKTDENDFVGELDKKLLSKNKLRGTLTEASQEFLMLEVEKSKLKIAFKKIKKINLDPEI